MKIVGNTVGTTLPKPNLMQNDPSKGDYVIGREEFAEQVGGSSAPGKDGIDCTHEWNGTVLTITSASGTSSADLKGDKGDDYTLTEADKQEIAEQAAGMVEIPSGYATEEYVRNKIAEAELGGEEVDLSGYAQKSELPTKVSQLENDKGYLTEHQDISGKLDASALPTAINTALAQAKASGEFDGAKGDTGEQGEPGPKGDKGDTGLQGIQGETGPAGANGKDGVSATHSWNDTVLTITSASGTSSADLKGAKGDKGDKGDSIKGDKGDTGATGATGPKPVKGVDYWTDADQEAIVQQVITALGTPVFGRVDAEKNIILSTSGVLADGTYTLWIEGEDGKLAELCTYNHSTAPEPTYTNQIPLSINADGTQYVGNNGENGYKTGYRLNSSGVEKELAESKVTGFIPVKYGDVVYLENMNFGKSADNTTSYVHVYNSSFATVGFALAASLTSYSDMVRENNIVTQFKVTEKFFGGNGTVGDATKIGTAAYIRINCDDISAESIITVNQPIV